MVPLTREKAPRYRRIHKAVTLPRALRSPGRKGRAARSHPGGSIRALHMPMHPGMSNVDAVRTLADEHHLEFVDLERFNLDASASSVIPVAVARKYHVVPIGRKFGAPVVATSNPADVVAMDDLRAVIGREFVAVVASGEQIDSCLVRIYGEPGPGADKRTSAVGSKPAA